MITKKNILIPIILLLFFTNIVKAEIVNNIDIKGNLRVNSETIKMFSGVTIGEDLSIIIKRGCTEFSVPYPKYKEIDESMTYNKEWLKKEKIIDDKIQKKNKYSSKIIQETLEGLSISDALIMKNWLFFAKSINDKSYKKFNVNIPDSEYLKLNN